MEMRLLMLRKRKINLGRNAKLYLFIRGWKVRTCGSDFGEIIVRRKLQHPKNSELVIQI